MSQQIDNIQAVINVAQEAVRPTPLTITRGDDKACTVVVIPGRAGHPPQVVDAKAYLDKYRERPERIIETVEVTSSATFFDLVKRFQRPTTAIFVELNADAMAASMTAIIDYHQGRVAHSTGTERISNDPDKAVEEAIDARKLAEAIAGAPDAQPINGVVPEWGGHRIRYTFPIADAWKAWSKKRSGMSQSDFAELIEDRIEDVVQPTTFSELLVAQLKTLVIKAGDQETLMAMTRGLAANISTEVETIQNRDNGEAHIVFSEKDTSRVKSGSRSVDVPTGLVASARVFDNGLPYTVPVRIRYVRDNGRLAWSITPYRTKETFQAAVTDVVRLTEAALGLPVFFGKAPAATAP